MPDNVNFIFGQNLRHLCEERGTYSEAARILGVSRVQLARYFKGESYPKPNQLARICDLFGVDARIYTETIEDLRSAGFGQPQPHLPIEPTLAPGLDRYLTAEHPVPSGIHMMYRPSFTLPERYIASPLLVRRTNRGTMLRAVEMIPSDTRRSESGSIARRSFRGIAFGTPDGVVMHFYGTGVLPFMTTAHFASSSFYMATGMFRGTYELFRPAQPEEFRRVPILMNILVQKPKTVLAAVRGSGIVDLSRIPDRVRDYLNLSGAV